MSRLAGLRVVNWLRFRGEHTIELGPTVYALVAEHVRDAERSNWLGKSALLSALRFAFFGSVPVETLDAAIHHGEPFMRCEVELDDGTFVTRTKRRGKPVEMVATWTEDGKEVDVRDQALLEQHLGFDEDTFLATCFFKQKSMSRFISAGAAARSTMVVEWLDLEPVQRAHAKVVARLAVVDATLAKLTGERQAHQTMLVADRDALVARRALVVEQLGSAKEELAVAQRREAQVGLQREYERVVEEIARCSQRPLKVVVRANAQAVKVLEEAAEVRRWANADYAAAVSNAAGKFDGQCPITCQACPVADTIRQGQSVLEERRDAAKVVMDVAQGPWEMARDRSLEIARELRIVQRRVELEGQRDRLAEQLVVGDEGPGLEDCERAVERFTRELTDIRAQQVADDRALHAIAEVVDRIKVAEEERRSLELAAKVLGRSGVQRRLASEFVEYLQDRATARLQDAGIDLTVRVYWGRETQQLAEACEQCGTAFPKTAKQKVCERCGAARGMKLDDKLHVELSDTSGAAEDLAGVALQLAAAEWIRAARGVDWATVILDEPFGALDVANRTALANVLIRLAEDGFEQAIVIAHDRNTLDGLPGRIQITADDRSSSVKVRA